MTYLKCLENITDFSETKKILNEKNLIVKEYNNLDLFLVKYNKEKCNMDDEDVRKCRGIILEKNTNKIVCCPPVKSIKHQEFFNSNTFSDIVVEDFIDGTMINIFKYNGNLHISTRSCIGAKCTWTSKKTFSMLFNESVNMDKFNDLRENLSLTFVLQHPDNTIVKKYVKPAITLVYATEVGETDITVLDRETLSPMLDNLDLTITYPKSFTFNTFEEVHSFVDKLHEREQGVILKCKNSYDRSKIRNEYYNYIRCLKGNTNNKKYLYFMLRQTRELNEYLDYFPEDTELFNIYRLELYSLTTRLFNFYQDCYVRFKDEIKEKVIKFADIDYEFKPLCRDLHGIYMSTKQPITKKITVNYVNNLPVPKLLFVLNYKLKQQKDN